MKKRFKENITKLLKMSSKYFSVHLIIKKYGQCLVMEWFHSCEISYRLILLFMAGLLSTVLVFHDFATKYSKFEKFLLPVCTIYLDVPLIQATLSIIMVCFTVGNIGNSKNMTISYQIVRQGHMSIYGSRKGMT